ncbi:MAG: type II secretion system F family protein [Candidatus Gracilibacteria bacterium]|nr:type II secretion system F family protein [Candidatus Gracilibacteria bacterium]
MPKFSYAATDVIGKKTEGVVDAPTKEAALQSLRAEDKIVLSMDEISQTKKWPFGRPKMSMQEKMIFVKNLSTMIEVGITITESLSIIRDQTKNKSFQKMYEDIMEMINSGQTLAKSLKNYDNNFSAIFINMISTGEESGNLQDVLRYLDIQLEKEYEIRKKIISALVYPAIIVSITLLMGIGIVAFIMPKITKIFDSFNIDLPLPTQLLISFSKLLTGSPFLSLGIFVGIVALFILLLKLKFLKPFWDFVFIKMPIFGSILISANVARFTRTMNSLLQASVPITDSLEITANMLDNALYKKALREVAAKVEQGGKLGESLEVHYKLFPPMCTKMFSLGERTGTLEKTAGKIAELYEKEVDAKTKNLAVAIEPLLLVLMAGLVGGIAISIIMPIYQLPNLLKK